METRLERSKRLKKQRRINRLKKLCILTLIILFFLGVEMVNQVMAELNDLKHFTIVGFDFNTKELHILGKTYIIDLSLIKGN